jgi:hypothetical protein
MKIVNFSIIHNENDARNQYLFPQIKKLKEYIEREFSVNVGEFFYQPKFGNENFSINLISNFLLLRVRKEWNTYVYSTIANVLLKNLYLNLKFFINELLKIKNVKKNALLKAIEREITKKHIRSWESFLESKSDFLICLEDDIIFEENSLSKMLEVLKKASAFHNESYIYIDLAGGFEIKDLKIPNSIYEMEGNFYKFSIPISNTACCYLLNRALVEQFVYHIHSRPWLNLLPLDWAINKIFIEMRCVSENFFCLHANPTIFRHGSLNNFYQKWH